MTTSRIQDPQTCVFTNLDLLVIGSRLFVLPRAEATVNLDFKQKVFFEEFSFSRRLGRMEMDGGFCLNIQTLGSRPNRD